MKSYQEYQPSLDQIIIMGEANEKSWTVLEGEIFFKILVIIAPDESRKYYIKNFVLS